MKKSESPTDLSDLFNLAQEDSSGRAPRLDLRYFFNLMLRFRWVLITPFCLAMLAGIFLAIVLPRMYQADAIILVEPQSVPDRYVHATVPVDIESRIASLTQQIMSRSHLTELIERYKLFSEDETHSRFRKLLFGDDNRKQFIEDKLERMRKHITVKIEGKRGGSKAGAFMISYKDSDPKKAFQVVNSMTNFVIDQNLKMRESSAYGTSDFLNDELEKMRTRLEEVERALEEYRRTHMGELPEQLQSNLTILERLQQQLGESHQRLRDEKNRLLMVENHIKLSQQAPSSTPGASLAAPSAEPKTVEGLRELLKNYESRYTANHPDVILLRKRIETLENELTESGKSLEPSALKAPPAAAGDRPFIEAGLRGQQQAIIRNTLAIEAEISSLRSQIEQYQKRVEDTPKREQEMLLLKRDYENIKTTYSSVLARKLESDIALNMEKKQKGEQFRILDPPRAAEKPVSPNLKLLFLGCVMAGLGIGGGIVFLREYFDNSVRRPEALESRFSLPVLMVMPSMAHMQPRRTRVLAWVNNGLSASAALACLALLAGLASLTMLDTAGVPEVLKQLLR